MDWDRLMIIGLNSRKTQNDPPSILLMVQKSGDHLLRLVVGSFSHYLQGFFCIQTVVGNGISEPSTAVSPEPLGRHFFSLQIPVVDAVDGQNVNKAYAVILPFRKKNTSISPDFKNGGWKPSFLFRKGYFFKGRTVKLLGCIFSKKPTNQAVSMLTSQNVPKYLGELNPLPQLGQPDMSISHGEASGPNK